MSISWKTKTFDELSTQELYQILRLRSEVFVVEQNCVYQDIDNKDQKALHLFGILEGEIIAYSRLFKPGGTVKVSCRPLMCVISRKASIDNLHLYSASEFQVMKRSATSAMARNSDALVTPPHMRGTTENVPSFWILAWTRSLMKRAW